MNAIYIIGSPQNSTFELYIAPRLSKKAHRKCIFIDCHHQKAREVAPKPANSMVIINRYVTREIITWLTENRSGLNAIFWLIDDDLAAMLIDRSIPLLNKIRPGATLYFKRNLTKLADHIFVSSKTLAQKFPDASVSILPPVFNFESMQDRKFNSRQLLYFAKMHTHEHSFLYPIVKQVLARNKNTHFEVIATGSWARRWRSLDRVTVLPEMNYPAYKAFITNRKYGGLFLVPLQPTRLNASRSFAKLLDVAATGSAGIVSNHKAYQDFLETSEYPTVSYQKEDWIEHIERLIHQPEKAKQHHDQLKALLQDEFNKREMIA